MARVKYNTLQTNGSLMYRYGAGGIRTVQTNVFLMGLGCLLVEVLLLCAVHRDCTVCGHQGLT